jgi:hypothetical protein
MEHSPSWEEFSRHALFYCFLGSLAHFSRTHSLGLVGHHYKVVVVQYCIIEV